MNIQDFNRLKYGTKKWCILQNISYINISQCINQIYISGQITNVDVRQFMNIGINLSKLNENESRINLASVIAYELARKTELSMRETFSYAWRSFNKSAFKLKLAIKKNSIASCKLI